MTKREADWEKIQWVFHPPETTASPIAKEGSVPHSFGHLWSLYCYGPAGGWGHKTAEKTEAWKKENPCDLAHHLRELGHPLPALWARTRCLPVACCCLRWCSLLGTRLCPVQAGGPGVGDGKLTTPLEVLQILVVFTHLPATVYFSETSNTCSVYSVQVLWLQSVGKTGWRVVTPSCSGP